MEKAVCICGAGTMGRGIALAAASRGIDSILYDLNPDMISKAASGIETELDKELAKKRISNLERLQIDRHISFTTKLADCRAPVIIEAIIENADVKAALFVELAKFNSRETIFATNTSSLSVTRIAGQTAFPEKIIGLHFFNPANRMKLVEIVHTSYTSTETLERTTAFAIQLGKTPVTCKDSPGFIVNRVARPFYLEALRLAERETADMATIDKLMESAGFKMGPFHLMDLIGNDINYTVSGSLYEALGRPARLRPSSLQETNVKQGYLGRKTGRGFFQYAKADNE
jgi:3-hydroxybutyryl-CoA dehydrogenase